MHKPTDPGRTADILRICGIPLLGLGADVLRFAAPWTIGSANNTPHGSELPFVALGFAKMQLHHTGQLKPGETKATMRCATFFFASAVFASGAQLGERQLNLETRSTQAAPGRLQLTAKLSRINRADAHAETLSDPDTVVQTWSIILDAENNSLAR